MKYRIFAKEKGKKAISILIVICFSTIAINQSIANAGNPEDKMCYGFVVTSVKCENGTLQNQINCKIRNLINDILRENIQVYWAAENFTIKVKKICDGKISEDESELFFERGAFVIPFTGNLIDDKKIVAMIYDYNQSCEIEDNNFIKMPAYLLVGTFEVVAHLLSEVKIAQAVSPETVCESIMMVIAVNCGFLNFDSIETKHLGKQLSNSNYNVIIWPGGEPIYPGSVLVDVIKSEFKKDSSLEAIRDFVNNGGGYIGICYGAYKASYCMLPLPLYLKRAAYNPNLHTFGLLAISDVSTRQIYRITENGFYTLAKIQITNNTHPLTYGLDKYLETILWKQGPKFLQIGKNSQVIAEYYEGGFPIENSPAWVSSKFGNGRVVLFAPHPEFGVLNSMNQDVGNDVISNALYYSTYGKIVEFQTNQSRNLSFISKIWEITKDLTSNMNTQENIFDEIEMKINELVYEVDSAYYYAYLVLNNWLKKTSEILNMIEKMHILLKDDSEYINNLTILKSDISEKINETTAIVDESFKTYEKLFKIRCKISPFTILGLSLRIKVFLSGILAGKLSSQGRELHRYIPPMYFNSLKFLRHYWYNYEASIAI